MSKKKEFDQFTGKPYDQLHDGVGYEKDFSDRNNNGIKDSKEELKETKRLPNPEDASINLSDVLNVLWAHLRNKAITELNPMQVAKASSFISYGFIGLFLLILGLVIGLWL